MKLKLLLSVLTFSCILSILPVSCTDTKDIDKAIAKERARRDSILQVQRSLNEQLLEIITVNQNETDSLKKVMEEAEKTEDQRLQAELEDFKQEQERIREER